MNAQRNFIELAGSCSKEECLEWPFSKTSHGYGRIGNTKAHRISFERHHRKLLDGEVVMHSCDNPICVNPFHLKAGSQKDNVLDMVAKGRRAITSFPETFSNKGEKHGRSKLTESQVREIKAIALRKIKSNREIGLMFGVSKTTIQGILSGKKWNHII